jgi:ABC-type antimicrobial peptide transport system permease subunit
VRDVLALANAKMLQGQRTQLLGLRTTVTALSVAIWALSVVFIGLVFTMAAHSRRRQIGVMRALGASRSTAARSLLAEGAVLGIAGGAAGILLAIVLALLIDRTNGAFGLPFVVPRPAQFLGLGALALLLAATSVAIASLPAVLRISRIEPAVAMRE